MNPFARRKARRLALQAIYQWYFTNDEISELTAQFQKDCNPKKVDAPYLSELIAGVINHATSLDEQMLPFLDRNLADINPVELAVLRIAIYELIYRLEIPYKVIINEALELAKAFGAEASFKYINGVLDKVAKQIRDT
ncbi:MAG: transcription antitermination factor NusB [Gammaproteobacteria bacterium]|nr:transcription antitermination factor NusB [Gammaproteobacteria bacterium]